MNVTVTVTATPSATATPPAEGGSILTGLNPLEFNIGDPLPLFIIQAIVIISTCYLVNQVVSRLRQPKVIAEVLSGIILGPSILGKIPGFNQSLFPSPSIPFLTLVANVGLVFFLFLVGLELDPTLVVKQARYAVGITVAGIVFPFAAGSGVSFLLYNQLEVVDFALPGVKQIPFGEFLLFCGVATCITAFPVLARILTEMKMLNTPVGFLTICAAAIGDVVAWTLLAIVVSIINSSSPITPLYVVLCAIGWAIFLAVAVRPVLLFLIKYTRSEEDPSQLMVAIVILTMLCSALFTHIVGVHAIFGGFLVGLIIPPDTGFSEGLAKRLEDLVGVVFLPLYFTLSGLKTHFDLMNNAEAWGLVLLVTVVACCGKIAGCVFAGRLNGLTYRETFAIGFLMNCKGLVEFIVLNIGYDSGALNPKVFVIMITVCLLETMIATPFVRFIYPLQYQNELDASRAAERARKAAAMAKSEVGDGVESREGLVLSSIGGRPSTTHDNEKYDDDDDDEEYGLGAFRRKRDMSYESGLFRQTNTFGFGNDAAPVDAMLFCVDKTQNASAVMAILQLFSDLGQRVHGRRQIMPSQQQQQQTVEGVLAPSVDLSDVTDSTDQLPRQRTQHQRGKTNGTSGAGVSGSNNNNLETTAATESPISLSGPTLFALRLLRITERNTSVLFGAARHMNHHHKDPIMTLMTCFSRLNSVTFRPLMSLSKDPEDEAQDILDQAERYSIASIVFPWNSSTLQELLNTSANQNTKTVLAPVTAQGQPILNPTIFASPQQLSLSPGSAENESHNFRNSIIGGILPTETIPDANATFEQSPSMVASSNTKVLTKLIRGATANKFKKMSINILVDRGLGHGGKVSNLVLVLTASSTDLEATLQTAQMAKGRNCSVTVLRMIAATPQSQSKQPPQMPILSRAATSAVPQIPRGNNATNATTSPHNNVTGRISESGSMPSFPSSSQAAGASETILAIPDTYYDSIPKSDTDLVEKFFPGCSLSDSHHGDTILHHQQYPVKTSDPSIINVLHFSDYAILLQWCKNALQPQDLVIMGHTVDLPPMYLEQNMMTGSGGGYLASPPKIQRNSSQIARSAALNDDEYFSGQHASQPQQPAGVTSSMSAVHLSPGGATAASTPGIRISTQTFTMASETGVSVHDDHGDVAGAGTSSIRGRSRGRGDANVASPSKKRSISRSGRPAVAASTMYHTETSVQSVLGLSGYEYLQSGAQASLLLARSRTVHGQVPVLSHEQLMSRHRFLNLSFGHHHHHHHHHKKDERVHFPHGDQHAHLLVNEHNVSAGDQEEIVQGGNSTAPRVLTAADLTTPRASEEQKF